MDIPLVGPAYQSASWLVSNQKCVNWFLEQGPESGRTPAQLYPTPGLRVFATLPGLGRAFFEADGRVFAVAGAMLCEIDRVGTVIVHGSIGGSGSARIVSNGVQLLVLSGGNVFTFTLATNTLALVTDTDMPQAATEAVVIDGFGIVVEPNSQRFFITSAYNFSAIDGLDFASAEGLPDDIVSVASLARELWIFGERTTEIWVNSGDEFPFTPSSNTFLEFGCIAAQSVQKMGGALYWLGRSTQGRPSVYRANSYQPENLAHHGINAILQQAELDEGLKQAWAWVYQDRGHSFYCLTLPTIKRTICFDSATNAWHERAWTEPNTQDTQHHLARASISAFGKVLVSDRKSSAIYELTEGASDDAGHAIIRTRSSPVIHAGQARVTLSSVEVMAEPGVGDFSEVSPTLDLRQSVDGGQSWGPWRSAPVGKVGEYSKRSVFARLGLARNRVIEIRTAAKVPIKILGAVGG